MNRLTLSVLVSSSLALSAWACGGKVTYDLGSGGSGGTGSGQTVTHATGSPATSGTGKASSSGNGTGTANVGSSGQGPVVGSASSGLPPGPPVSCNGGPCNPGEICCFNPNGPGDHCGQAGQCDQGFVELDCSTPANCPNAVCCAQFDPNGQVYQGISCQPTCDGPDQITVCTNMPPSPCPNGTQCHKSMQLGDGYRVCF